LKCRMGGHQVNLVVQLTATCLEGQQHPVVPCLMRPAVVVPRPGAGPAANTGQHSCMCCFLLLVAGNDLVAARCVVRVNPHPPYWSSECTQPPLGRRDLGSCSNMCMVEGLTGPARLCRRCAEQRRASGGALCLS
jgi:hypothetical protein